MKKEFTVYSLCNIQNKFHKILISNYKDIKNKSTSSRNSFQDFCYIKFNNVCEGYKVG